MALYRTGGDLFAINGHAGRQAGWVRLDLHRRHREDVDAGDVDVVARLGREHESENAGSCHRGADDQEPEDAVVREGIGGEERCSVDVGQVEDVDAEEVGGLGDPVLVQGGGREGVEGGVKTRGRWEGSSLVASGVGFLGGREDWSGSCWRNSDWSWRCWSS